MKILFQRNCAVGGKHCSAGTVQDVADAVALQLIGLGRAVAAGESPVADPRDRSVGLTTSDAPALLRRGKGRKDGD